MSRVIIRSNGTTVGFETERYGHHARAFPAEVPQGRHATNAEIVPAVEQAWTPAAAAIEGADRPKREQSTAAAGASRGRAGAATNAGYAVTAMLRVASDDLEDVVEECLSDTRCVGVRVQRLQRGDSAPQSSRSEAVGVSMAHADRRSDVRREPGSAQWGLLGATRLL